MAKRRKAALSSQERKRRQLKSSLDQLRKIKHPTQQDMDLMSELQQALHSFRTPIQRR